jgi:hypothetical protein
MQFVPYPADSPDALRLAFQEELQEQFIFFGLLPLGLYAIRTDPGTTLNSVLSGVRRLVGSSLTLTAGVVEAGLQALGYLPQKQQ